MSHRTPSEIEADDRAAEIEEYRLQVEAELEEEQRRMNEEINRQMQEIAAQNGITMDEEGDWVEENPDAAINQSISMKDFLEFMNKLRQTIAGPIPGEPKYPFNLRKKTPDNEEDQGHAIKVVGGKRKKKRKKKTKKKKRKHRKKRTRKF